VQTTLRGYRRASFARDGDVDAIAATYAVARRAARIDPTAALRMD